MLPNIIIPYLRLSSVFNSVEAYHLFSDLYYQIIILLLLVLLYYIIILFIIIMPSGNVEMTSCFLMYISSSNMVGFHFR